MEAIGSLNRRLALVANAANDSENVGDESLVPELAASVKLAKLTNRVAELERRQVEDRAAINRILTRFATDRRPILPTLPEGA